ncbi:hypothetical protein GCM10022284_68290 [Streptomyces hundungensis]
MSGSWGSLGPSAGRTRTSQTDIGTTDRGDSVSHETHWSLEKTGFRAQLAVHTGGRVVLRSRQGTDLLGAFPEIGAAALAQLPPDTGLDGVM